MKRVFAAAAMLWVGACAPETAPRELEGLWSRSAGGCAAQAGVRFGDDAVRVHYGRSQEVLFADPRYRVERRGAIVRITVTYRRPAEAASASRRTLVLERDAADGLRPVAHDFADGSTGAVRVDLGGEDFTLALTLRRCPTPEGKG